MVLKELVEYLVVVVSPDHVCTPLPEGLLCPHADDRRGLVKHANDHAAHGRALQRLEAVHADLGRQPPRGNVLPAAGY